MRNDLYIKKRPNPRAPANINADEFNKLIDLIWERKILTTAEHGNLADGLVMKTELLITSAEILDGNVTPITIPVAAPGAGKFIEPLSFSGRMVFNTSAYATNTDLAIRYNGKTDPIAQFATGVLANTANNFGRALFLDNNAMEVNTQLEIYVPTGNPSGGDSDFKLYMTYTISDI